MARVCRLYAAVLAALALCKYSLAGSHVTEASANQTVSTGNGDNGTESTTDGQWTGHFSKCPEAFTNYCIHGECRYIKEQHAPSCRCQHGYIGSRCEYLDLDWRIGGKRQIIVACVIAGLVFLILLIVFICICSHRRCRLCWRRRRRRRREEPRNGSEKLSMMETHTPLASESEPTHTDAV
ncbi:hypothetical protein CesoFtcFv8_023801 [Champsocephalus esox]|uniref:EGF-like domain-containing protein n=1 Tax=Champsocephalus esox TaxID=159716 RepID=A0AAN8B4H7_9TELE|nr:hypothetical protein CesoFtcFv8_023801 [Champsocephalus esox]